MSISATNAPTLGLTAPDWRKADNVLERIALFSQARPRAEYYTIRDEFEARELLTALAATYTKILEERPPTDPHLMAQSLAAIREFDNAVIAGNAFPYLDELIRHEPLEFYGLKLSMSVIVLQ